MTPLETDAVQKLLKYLEGMKCECLDKKHWPWTKDTECPRCRQLRQNFMLWFSYRSVPMTKDIEAVKRYTANVWLNVTPDGVSLADPELRSVVLAQDYDTLEKERDEYKSAWEEDNAALGKALLANAELERRVGEMEKDAARLDWLLSDHARGQAIRVQGSELRGWAVIDMSDGVRILSRATTARAAIDAALSAGNEERPNE